MNKKKDKSLDEDLKEDDLTKESKTDINSEEEVENSNPETDEKLNDKKIEDGEKNEIQQEKTIEEELEEYKDNLRRLQAEFENYRKRVAKEKSDIYKYDGFEVFESLLPILDNYYRAVEIESDDPKVKSFLEGFSYISKQFNDLFEKHNIVKLASQGEELDPEKHQAIQSEEVEGKEEKDEVAEILQQGYAMHERTLRVASVKVKKIRTTKKGEKNE